MSRTALILSIALTSVANWPPPAIDCSVIRAQVAQWGEPQAIAWAIAQGYTIAQINLARKLCLQARSKVK